MPETAECCVVGHDGLCVVCASQMSVVSGSLSCRFDSLRGFRCKDSPDCSSVRAGSSSAAPPSGSHAEAQRRRVGRPIRMISAPWRLCVRDSSVQVSRAFAQEGRRRSGVRMRIPRPSRGGRPLSGLPFAADFLDAYISASHDGTTECPDSDTEWSTVGVRNPAVRCSGDRSGDLSTWAVPPAFLDQSGHAVRLKQRRIAPLRQSPGKRANQLAGEKRGVKAFELHRTTPSREKLDMDWPARCRGF